MLKTYLSQLLLVTALMALTDTAYAAPPPGMTTFTARLADGNGPLTGNHDFAFALYAAPTGGSALWSETHNSVLLEQGLASIALGGTTSLTTVLFDGSTRYLEVIVDGSALDTRVPIYSVPYALRAGVASQAEGLAPGLQSQLDGDYFPLGSSLACGAGQVVTALAANGNVTCAIDGKGVAAAGGGLAGTAVGNNIELSLATGAVTSAHILDGTIGSADLASSIINSEHIVDSAVNSEKIKDGAVAGVDIAANAIDGTKVSDGSLTGADIQNASIDGGDIASDSIGAGHLLANSVSSSEIVDASITSTELAANACDVNQIAANAVTGAKIADNAVGASEVANNSLGADEVSLPMFTSFAAAGVTLASGANDIFVPTTFAATTTGECMVTAMGRLTNAGASAVGGVSLRVITRTVGGSTVPDATIAPVAGQYPGVGQTHVTKAHVMTTVGGNTYEFGCRLSASLDWIGDTGECQVTVFCQ
jgi:hypothetical protein